MNQFEWCVVMKRRWGLTDLVQYFPTRQRANEFLHDLALYISGWPEQYGEVCSGRVEHRPIPISMN